MPRARHTRRVPAVPLGPLHTGAEIPHAAGRCLGRTPPTSYGHSCRARENSTPKGGLDAPPAFCSRARNHGRRGAQPQASIAPLRKRKSGRHPVSSGLARPDSTHRPSPAHPTTVRGARFARGFQSVVRILPDHCEARTNGGVARKPPLRSGNTPAQTSLNADKRRRGPRALTSPHTWFVVV